MTLRTKFLIAVILVHGVLVALAAQFRVSNPVLFVASEAVLLASAYLTYQLYLGFVRPFQLIAAGTEAIQAKDFTMKFVPVGQHEMDQLIGVYNAMIDHLREERVTQHEKSYLLQQLIDASPAGILLLDFDGRIAEANPAATDALQLPGHELLGLPPTDLPGEWGRVLGSLRAGDPQVIRLSGVQTYRAHCAGFIDRGFPRSFILLEELTRDLIRQEKQAYEKLIRMMSHEINNSIGAVNSLLQSFHYYAHHLPAADQPDFTEALEVAHTRNTHLVNFIGSFATLVRLPAPQRRPVDVHELLRATHRLLSVPSQQRRISWEWDLAPGPLWIQADGVQLEQALLNIAKNALEAIPAERGGTLTVRTSAHPPEIRLENDGAPIPLDVQRRLFTPFFSTKRDGQGIGLTLVRDILLAHDYRFALETQPDGVTAFTIWLAPVHAPVATADMSS